MAVLSRHCRSPYDWGDLGSAIVRLYQSGVLVRPDAPPRAAHGRPGGYDRPGTHTRMLNDRVRTESFIAALRALVRPEDVVIDLGTGTGVLAVAAAQCGARHVYAIEASEIASVAEQVVALNGVGSRVTILRGVSTGVTVPERATLLISEMIGNDPLGERTLPLLRDARLRLCRDDARMIPERLELYLLPVAVDPEFVARRLPTRDRLAAWRQSYGIDLSPLAGLPRQGWEKSFVEPDEAAIEALGPPASLGTFVLGDPFDWPVKRRATLRTDRAGQLSGILLYFEATLAPGIRLSLDPRGKPASHWVLPLWLRLSPVPVAAGQTWICSYSRDEDSDLTIEMAPAQPAQGT